MMGIMVPETCWASNKICNKNHLFHLVGIYFHILMAMHGQKHIKFTVGIFVPVSRNCQYEISNAPNDKEQEICDSWRTEQRSSENQCGSYTSHDLILQVTAQTRRVDEGLMGCKWINQLDEVKSHTTWLWSSNYLNSTSLWAVR